MGLKDVANVVEGVVLEDWRVRLFLTLFFVPPLLFVLFVLFGEQVFLAWLVAVGSYALALVAWLASKAAGSWRGQEVTRSLLSMLGPLAWGGVVQLFYLLLYSVVFE